MFPTNVSTCSSTFNGIAVAMLGVLNGSVAGISRSCKLALSIATFVMTEINAAEFKSEFQDI